MSKTNISNEGTNNGTIIGTQNINNYNNYIKVPTLLSSLIKKLCNIFDENPNNLDITILPYTPEEKILYNNVIQYKYIIMDNSKYYSTCNSILDTLDNHNIGCKSKILKSIKLKYDEIAGELLVDNPEVEKIEVIRQNADNIINKMKSFLRIRLEQCDEVLTQEDIDCGLVIIVVYAFLECKILENPKGVVTI